jgi:hypothetical protein
MLTAMTASTRFSPAQPHYGLICGAGVSDKLTIVSHSIPYPIGNQRAITAARAVEIEDKVGPLIEPMLTTNCLNVVAI